MAELTQRWYKIATTTLRGHQPRTVWVDFEPEGSETLILHTKNGPEKARYVCTIESTRLNPFTHGHAKCHVTRISTEYYNTESETPIMLPNTTFVKIRHNQGKFLVDAAVPKDMSVQVSQVVVYERETDVYSVGTIEEVYEDAPQVSSTKWYPMVVDVVDFTSFNQSKNAIKELAILRKKIAEKRKQFQEIDILTIMSKTDPEAAELLEAFTALMK